MRKIQTRASPRSDRSAFRGEHLEESLRGDVVSLVCACHMEPHVGTHAWPSAWYQAGPATVWRPVRPQESWTGQVNQAFMSSTRGVKKCHPRREKKGAGIPGRPPLSHRDSDT